MELFDLVSAGKIVNEPKQTFALADAAEAHRALEARKTVGATVLVALRNFENREGFRHAHT